jgi:hypothetical protein
LREQQTPNALVLAVLRIIIEPAPVFLASGLEKPPKEDHGSSARR